MNRIKEYKNEIYRLNTKIAQREKDINNMKKLNEYEKDLIKTYEQEIKYIKIQRKNIEKESIKAY